MLLDVDPPAPELDEALLLDELVEAVAVEPLDEEPLIEVAADPPAPLPPSTVPCVEKTHAPARTTPATPERAAVMRSDIVRMFAQGPYDVTLHRTVTIPPMLLPTSKHCPRDTISP